MVHISSGARRLSSNFRHFAETRDTALLRCTLCARLNKNFPGCPREIPGNFAGGKADLSLLTFRREILRDLFTDGNLRRRKGFRRPKRRGTHAGHGGRTGAIRNRATFRQYRFRRRSSLEIGSFIRASCDIISITLPNALINFSRHAERLEGREIAREDRWLGLIVFVCKIDTK